MEGRKDEKGKELGGEERRGRERQRHGEEEERDGKTHRELIMKEVTEK